MGTRTRPGSLLPDIEPVQLLDPSGRMRDHDDFHADLDAAELVEMYEQMVVTRALDRELVNLQRQGQLALVASCRGQEAAQVGSARACRADDWMTPQYRELGAAVVRGVDPVGIGRFWRSSWHGTNELLKHHITHFSVPIATQCLHAAGLGMGMKIDGDDTVVMCYFGDGATSEGDAHEAMNFAAVFEAPVVFFVQNNQWAISVPVAEQTRSLSIAHKAVAYGMPGVRVDGNDVVGTYAVCHDAVERARAGEGPTLIEAVTYRMEPHTTSDDAGRYLPEGELDHWAELDPIARVERHLRSVGELDDETAAAITERATRATTHLREGLWDVPPVEASALFDHVYVTEPPSFAEQRAQLAAETEARADLEAPR